MMRYNFLSLFVAIQQLLFDAFVSGAGQAGNLRQAAAAVDQDSDSKGEDIPYRCPNYIPFEEGHSIGQVDAHTVGEASGLVASASNKNILFTHNDFGHGPKLLASHENGTIVGEFVLDGAGSVDYEDIAAGNGPIIGENYLYVGDIGDVKLNRLNVVIYRIVEPIVKMEDVSNNFVRIREWDSLTLTYPETPQNAEALMYDPITGFIFIISRTDGSIWRTEHVWGEGDADMNLVKVGTKKSQAKRPATGADISRDGREILVKHYSTILYYCREIHEDVGIVLSTREGVKVPYQREIKGESIAFAAQRDSGYYTLSESGKSVNEVPLYQYNRIKK